MEAFFMAIIILVSFISGSQPITFTFKNNCIYKIWPATSGTPQLASTGFELPAGASSALDVPPNWSAGRFWARTGCTTTGPSGRFTCDTGDCASGQVTCNGAGGIPPMTLAEITVKGYGGVDFFDISLVDGFNLPISMAPANRSCKATGCPRDVNRACPPELAVKGYGGAVIACKSACLAFKSGEYCCKGSYSTPKSCPPTRYSKIFKGQCPQAYTYAFDDATSTFTCPTGTNYLVTFCP